MASLKNSAGNVFVETGLCCNFESHFFTSQNAMYFRTRLNYFVQLSQLEDPRWPRRDLPCPPEVRLQHLRRQWRQCSHPQVLWINIYRQCSELSHPGTVLWTRRGSTALERVCRSWKPGRMLLETFPTAGIELGLNTVDQNGCRCWIVSIEN